MPISTYGSLLYEEYGAWQAFIDPSSNIQSYFDDQGNEWATGTGPAPNLGSGNAFTGYSGSSGVGSTVVTPTAPAVAQPTTSPNTSSISTTLSNSLTNVESLLSGSLFGGIPNWILAGGVVLFFMLSGGESNGRSK